MNPDDVLDEVLQGTITMNNGTYSIATGNGLTALGVDSWSAANVVSTAATPLPKVTYTVDEIMDEFVMNRISVDYKVAGHELLAIQARNPDYASEIKENIAKNLTREVTKKISYTKKHDKDTDVHHFIGRVWIFTDEELKTILEKR